MTEPASRAKIEIGQVFSVSPDSSGEYWTLTKGTHTTGANAQKGIWAYSAVREPGQLTSRVPAVILHSNPFKGGTEATPWVDIVEPELGYAMYHGDNHHSSRPPLEASGNKLLAALQPTYSDADMRAAAPPVLLFSQAAVNGRRRGYRAFSGYGVPVAYRLVAQREKASSRYFTNLLLELALFGLVEEDERFRWEWIDARRDSRMPASEALKFAPAAWRRWVRSGMGAIEQCRRHVAKNRSIPPDGQIAADADKQVLTSLEAHFRTTRHSFEGLASLIATRVFGEGCRRGWVTKRSGDGGVDFVCRLDIGSEFSRVPVVILGQAKCQRAPVSGSDLARVVARLQRGWIGVFVTTGAFSRAAQEELHSDKYPVLLIHGGRLAREVRLILNEEGITLDDLLDRERHWYEANIQPLEPSRILDDSLMGAPLLNP